jgi:hypothetical protein
MITKPIKALRAMRGGYSRSDADEQIRVTDRMAFRHKQASRHIGFRFVVRRQR